MKDRFVGLTMPQFALAVAVVFMLALGAQSYSVYENARLADQGAEAHASLCVFKHDLEQRAESSRAFLALTPRERVRKYGPALGAIPTTTIQQGLRGQEATLASLHSLNCN